MFVEKTKRVERWYFGGVASAMSSCCVHPLDLLKVHLQTQQGKKVKMVTLFLNVVRHDGFLALYNGVSAAVLRQLTYSLTRFAIYDSVKIHILKEGQSMPFYQKVLLAGLSGGIAGIASAPADLVNVRMQNDIKLPEHQRRNYKHALDGLWRVFHEEGICPMYGGMSMACCKTALVTIGQLACYDQFKSMLVSNSYFTDDIFTHFTAGIMAGVSATALTMPVDNMKTRMMNAVPGTYKSLFAVAKDIAKNGPSSFYKGFMARLSYLGPHTILTFIYYEQLRIHFGYQTMVN